MRSAQRNVRRCRCPRIARRLNFSQHHRRVVDAFHARHGRLAASELQPVLLVPGIIGSGLSAEIDKNYKPAWNCFKKWRTPWGIWVNLYEALAQTCWFDNLMIRYNDTLDSFSNNPGVKIRPNDFGGILGVDKLDHFDDPFDLTVRKRRFYFFSIFFLLGLLFADCQDAAGSGL
jgi:hypothetical protein